MVALLLLIPFVWMIYDYAYFINVESEYAINNSFNPRQAILAAQTTRGRILASDLTVLAETVTDVDGTEERVYPFDNLYAHVVGYDSNGMQGIELLANYQLLQSDISLTSKMENELNGDKNPGNDVVTTLVPELQEIAEDVLGVYDGAVVVLDVDTGQVLAMVSKPDYDPNEISDIWDDLLQDTTSSVLLNRTTQGLYPPGSVFKMITAIAYLEENNNDIDSYYYTCGGSITVDGERITCYHGSVHGGEDLYRSFAKSCNTSFANIGINLDLTSFNYVLDQMYFNQTMPIQLTSSASSVVVDENSTAAELLQMSIGQGTTLVTPIHMAMIAAAIANDGEMMKPYFVESILSAEGSVVKTYSPTSLGVVMSEEVSDSMVSLMTEVVETGTATKLDGLSYTAAGKTGSAEYNSNALDSHAWFVGFAPAEEPEIAIAIIVEGAGSGGDYAVPMAKRVFDTYFEE